MALVYSFKLLLFIFSSVFVNLYFVFFFFRRGPELTWTKRAAEEAEAIARVSCSGHGFPFSDGLFVAGKPVCECSSCYRGSDCSEFKPDCLADADSGDPRFMEPFWMKKSESSTVVIAGWHRLSYFMGDGSLISAELEKTIRRLHMVVGNANPAGKFIAFGVGSMQLIKAAVHALSPENSPVPVRVVSTFPYYAAYKVQTDFSECGNFKWPGEATKWKNNYNSDATFVEFVTLPNNPDGQNLQPGLEGPTAKGIYDHAYYWPHFTPILAAADQDIMLFTLSKLTGHAGSRFGWALVKDKGVHERMSNYILLNTLGVSHETQLRAHKLLQVVLEERGK